MPNQAGLTTPQGIAVAAAVGVVVGAFLLGAWLRKKYDEKDDVPLFDDIPEPPPTP